jgi:hypothetical protein
MRRARTHRRVSRFNREKASLGPARVTLAWAESAFGRDDASSVAVRLAEISEQATFSVRRARAALRETSPASTPTSLTWLLPYEGRDRLKDPLHRPYEGRGRLKDPWHQPYVGRGRLKHPWHQPYVGRGRLKDPWHQPYEGRGRLKDPWHQPYEGRGRLKDPWLRPYVGRSRLKDPWL